MKWYQFDAFFFCVKHFSALNPPFFFCFPAFILAIGPCSFFLFEQFDRGGSGEKEERKKKREKNVSIVEYLISKSKTRWN